MRCVLFVGGVVLTAALGACKAPKGVEIELRRLIPPQATVLAGFELASLRVSPVGSALHTALQSDGETRAMLQAVTACEIDLTGLRGTLATTTENTDDSLIVIEAPGIGTEKAVVCLENEGRRAQNLETGLLDVQTRGDVRVVPQEGGGHLIILNPNQIAVVSQKWQDSVFSAIENPATATENPSFTKSWEHVDAGTDLWFAIAISPQMKADGFAVPGVSSVDLVTVRSTLADGATLEAVAELSDAAQAKPLVDAIKPLLAEFGTELEAMKLPKDLLSSTSFEIEGARVRAKLALTSSSLDSVVGLFLTMGG